MKVRVYRHSRTPDEMIARPAPGKYNPDAERYYVPWEDHEAAIKELTQELSRVVSLRRLDNVPPPQGDSE